jgi:hypothetical protein
VRLQVVPAPADESLRGRVGLNVKVLKDLQIAIGDPLVLKSLSSDAVCAVSLSFTIPLTFIFHKRISELTSVV